MCPADGWVVIHNSEHLCGAMDKNLFGGGNKCGLLSVLLRENSAAAAAQVPCNTKTYGSRHSGSRLS